MENVIFEVCRCTQFRIQRQDRGRDQRLMKAKEVYEQIQHPLLVPYINPIQMQNGFCLRFHWIDGECMHNHWDFTPFEKHHAPNSPFVKLRQLSVTESLTY